MVHCSSIAYQDDFLYQCPQNKTSMKSLLFQNIKEHRTDIKSLMSSSTYTLFSLVYSTEKSNLYLETTKS